MRQHVFQFGSFLASGRVIFYRFVAGGRCVVNSFWQTGFVRRVEYGVRSPESSGGEQCLVGELANFLEV